MVAPTSHEDEHEVAALARHWLDRRLKALLALRHRTGRKLSVDLVHDLRVACRRLRAALSLFEAPKAGQAWVELDRAARRLARLVAPLRELDVAAQALRTGKPGSPSERRASAALVRRWKRKRQEKEQDVGERLPRRFRRLKRLAKEIDHLPTQEGGASGAEPRQPDEAGRWLRSRFTEIADEARAAAEAVEAAPADEALAALHRARVAVKHLRYAAEIVDELPSPGVDAAARRTSSTALRKLQEAGGELQDLVDIVQRLEKASARGHLSSDDGEALLRRFLQRREDAKEAFVARLETYWPRPQGDDARTSAAPHRARGSVARVRPARARARR